MTVLLDTQILIWIAEDNKRLTQQTRGMIDSEESRFFSVASIWEVAIKSAQNKPEFQVDPHKLRRELMRSSFQELPIDGDHALAVLALPPIHKDPVDRLLIAQASVEAMTLITSDETIAKYPGAVHHV